MKEKPKKPLWKPQSLLYDPTKEKPEEAASRIGVPTTWLIPDVRQPGAMEALGYEKAFEIGGEQWYHNPKAAK
jgi:hypothetical protein